MSSLEIAEPVQTLISVKNGDEYGITKIIDDDLYRRRIHELRTALGGTRGMIRDAKGRAQAQFKYSIPVEEFNALLMQNDPDAKAWYFDKNDKRALARLVARFPHWKVIS